MSVILINLVSTLNMFRVLISMVCFMQFTMDRQSKFNERDGEMGVFQSNVDKFNVSGLQSSMLTSHL